MKVLDLRCAHGHGFEGWFASEEDFLQQHERGLVECPLCGDKTIGRLPSAPRLNFGASEPRPAAPARTDTVQLQPATLQHLWVEAVKHVMARTEDVGERFPEEARRIHYGEAESRGIRGQATEQERAALQEEGIEVVALPVPAALKGPTH
jgi:hypothetical protein